MQMRFSLQDCNRTGCKQVNNLSINHVIFKIVHFANKLKAPFVLLDENRTRV